MELYDVLREKEGILVLISKVEGSAPRDEGSWMFVDKEGMQINTIGGGNMEFRAYHKAMEMIKDERETREIEDMILGVDLGQCCGGRIEIVWQPIFSKDANIFKRGSLEMSLDDCDKGLNVDLLPKERSFSIKLRAEHIAVLHIIGAGHIGVEIKSKSEGLPLECIQWDTRQNRQGEVRLLKKIEDLTPTKGAFFLVMTYSHDLDYKICLHLLSEGVASYVGLIGSKTKAARFLSRFRKENLSDDMISRWHCPIGLSDYRGKELNPSEVAISVLADILRRVRRCH